MAKRRRLTAPDTVDLDSIEDSFAAKPKINPFDGAQSSAPPIAKVSAEAAQLKGLSAVADRVEMARDKADAERWRDARAHGRAVQTIALEDIDRAYLRRDRMKVDEDELGELLYSIRTNGLRSPIELVQLDSGYGLVSGYRRLEAFIRLSQQDADFKTIPAFVRSTNEGADTYVAMVEENELRANLTPYERGRIAVLVTGQGVFETVEQAVDQLFAAASKAKRSKVRSFALVHEALGDLLQFPEGLSERLGLNICRALRAGEQTALRAALAEHHSETAQDESAVIERLLHGLAAVDDAKRGGRPKQVTRLSGGALPDGGTLSAEIGLNSVRIDLKGRALNSTEVETIMHEIRKQLS